MDPIVPRHDFIDLLRTTVNFKLVFGTILVILFGLALIILSFASSLPSVTHSWETYSIRSIGTGLVVAAITGLLLQGFVQRYRQQLASSLEGFLREDITRDLHGLAESVGKQTGALVRGSATLEAIRHGGVSGVWESRFAALEEMRKDLIDPEARSVRLMGISLNDFLRSDQNQSLHALWKVLTEFMRGQRRPESEALAIRVLIIDPLCNGAVLRSHGESREDDDLAGRLDEDVMSTARRLLDLKREVEGADLSVANFHCSFDFRFYRAAPTLFLFSTEKASYMQPYYFWARRQFETSMPVLRFENTGRVQAMNEHFDLLWDCSSVDGEARMEANEVGSEYGANYSGMLNIFSKSQNSYDRLTWSIKHARHRVWLQGISLRSFFDPGELQTALILAIRNPEVDVRILLLDPQQEQGKYRSFREHAFADHCDVEYDTYEDYLAAPRCHQESTLA